MDMQNRPTARSSNCEFALLLLFFYSPVFGGGGCGCDCGRDDGDDGVPVAVVVVVVDDSGPAVDDEPKDEVGVTGMACKVCKFRKRRHKNKQIGVGGLIQRDEAAAMACWCGQAG